MDFFKKNYMKLVIAVVLLVGAIFFIAQLVQYQAAYHAFVNPAAAIPGAVQSSNDIMNANSFLFTYLAALTFFVLTLAAVILSMIPATKSYTKWVALSVGVLGTIFMFVAIVCALGSDTSAFARQVASGHYDAFAAMLPDLIARKGEIAYLFFSRVVTLVTYLILFGLLPLAFAIKKIVKKKAA